MLLAGIFGLSVVYGYAGLPHMSAGRIPVRAALGLHCLVTGVIATMAVSLSLVVKHGSDPLTDQGRWLLCGAVAAYFTLGVATGVASHSSGLQRTISRVVTGIAVPLLLGVLASDICGRTLVVFLALVVLAHLVVRTATGASPTPRLIRRSFGCRRLNRSLSTTPLKRTTRQDLPASPAGDRGRQGPQVQAAGHPRRPLRRCRRTPVKRGLR